MGATAAGVLSSLGQTGEQFAGASFKGQEWKQQQQEQQLRMLQLGLALQELRQRIQQEQLPQFLGSFSVPGGGVKGITRDPTRGTLGTMELYGGLNVDQATAAVEGIIQAIPDDEGKKAGRAIYQGLLANTRDPQIAIQGLTKFAEAVVQKHIAAEDWQRKAEDRQKYGRDVLHLTGQDLTAYTMGLTGATSYSFTPGGQRALHPPSAAGAGDVGGMAERVASGELTMAQVPSKDRKAVIDYMDKYDLHIPDKPTTTAKAKRDQANVVIAFGQDLLQQLQNPELRKYLGPVMGRMAEMAIKAGVAPAVVQAFHTSLESFVNMQPALHGSRGVGMVREFKLAVPNMGTRPENIEAAVHKLMDAAQQFIVGGTVKSGANVPAEVSVPGDDNEDVPPPPGSTEDQP
jgi:hypothetical protein